MVNMAILQLTIVTSLVLGALCQAPCTQTSACTCSLSNGMVVDLTPLKDQRFDVIDPNGANKYDIQFCQTFSMNSSACQDVYGCQFTTFEGGQYISIGKNVTFNHTELITLRDGDRTTIIGVYCNKAGTDSFTFQNESPLKTYNFKLNSIYACQVQGPTTPTTPTTTSTSTSNTTQTSTSTSTANTTSTTATTTTTPSNTTHTTSNTTASTVTTKTTPSSNSTSTTSQSTSTSTKTTSTSTVTTKSSPKTATTAASKTTKKGKANSLSSATVAVLMLVACITRSLF